MHPLTDVSQYGPPLAVFPDSGEHASYMNALETANDTDGVPVFATSEDNGAGSYWGKNEILAVYPNPSDPTYGGDVWRFGQHGASGNSSYYPCQFGKGTVTRLGDGVLFTSDMGGVVVNGATVLGPLDKAGNPRCDVFFIEAK